MRERIHDPSAEDLVCSGVYLLEAEWPYRARSGKLTKQVRYYLGFAWRIDRRVDEHRRGQGARLTRLFIECGIPFRVALVVPGATRADERRLKRNGHYVRLTLHQRSPK